MVQIFVLLTGWPYFFSSLVNYRMPAAPPAEPAAPVQRTELQELQYKAQTCTDEVINWLFLGIDTNWLIV